MGMKKEQYLAILLFFLLGANVEIINRGCNAC